MHAVLRAHVLKQLRHFLKPYGYKASGAKYRKDESELVKFIWLTSHPHSGPDELWFTLDISIATEKVVAHSPKFFFAGIDHVQAPFNARIGWLCPYQRDHWWKVRSEAECHTALAEVEGILITYVLPLLEAIRTNRDLAIVLRERRTGVHWPEKMRLWLADILEGKDVPDVPPGSTL